MTNLINKLCDHCNTAHVHRHAYTTYTADSLQSGRLRKAKYNVIIAWLWSIITYLVTYLSSTVLVERLDKFIAKYDNTGHSLYAVGGFAFDNIIDNNTAFS